MEATPLKNETLTKSERLLQMCNMFDYFLFFKIYDDCFVVKKKKHS